MSLFPLSSPVDALREYLSRMDIEMLELILSDNNTYNNLSKSVFLEKLNAVFEEFKRCGDTRLHLYRGECNNCYKRCQGYTLSGNLSNNYLDLLVKEENGDIKDIFYCSDLLNYKEFQKESKYSIQFEIDEAADYVMEEDYLILLHQCDNAIQEWTGYRNRIVYYQDMCAWTSRYKDLYEELVIYFMYSKHQQFFSLYRNMKALIEIHKQSHLIQKEMNGIAKIIKNGHYQEKELLKWLIKNEETGRSDVGEIGDFVDGKEFLKGRILLDRNLRVYLDQTEYKVFFEYQKLFSKYYEEKLMQYSVFSDEELESLEPETELYEKAGSLRYNIEQRKQYGFSL